MEASGGAFALAVGVAGQQAQLGIVAGGARVLTKLASREPEVLYRTVVQPGEVFEIVTASPSRKGKGKRT